MDQIRKMPERTVDKNDQFIPNEVLQPIMSYLRIPDLLSCRSVSKQWNANSTEVLKKRNFFALKLALQYCDRKTLLNCRLVNKDWKTIASGILANSPNAPGKDLELNYGHIEQSLFVSKESLQDFPFSTICSGITESPCPRIFQWLGRGSQITTVKLKIYEENRRATLFHYPFQYCWEILTNFSMFLPNIRKLAFIGFNIIDYDRKVFNKNQQSLFPDFPRLEEFIITLTNETQTFGFPLGFFGKLLQIKIPNSCMVICKSETDSLYPIVPEILDIMTQQFGSERVKLIYPGIKNGKLQLDVIIPQAQYQWLEYLLETQSQHLNSLHMNIIDSWSLFHRPIFLPRIPNLCSFSIQFPNNSQVEKLTKNFSIISPDQVPNLQAIELINLIDFQHIFSSAKILHSVTEFKIPELNSLYQPLSQSEQNNLFSSNLRKLNLNACSQNCLEVIFTHLQQLEQLEVNITDELSLEDINITLTGLQNPGVKFINFMDYYYQVNGNKLKLKIFLNKCYPRPGLTGMKKLKSLSLIFKYFGYGLLKPEGPNRLSDHGAYMSLLVMQQPLDKLVLTYTDLSEECIDQLKTYHRNVEIYEAERK